MGPADLATIYDVLPLWNSGIDGTGQAIAIVVASNFNIQDVRDFRSLFGLPAKDPVVGLNGTDPGNFESFSLIVCAAGCGGGSGSAGGGIPRTPPEIANAVR